MTTDRERIPTKTTVYRDSILLGLQDVERKKARLSNSELDRALLEEKEHDFQRMLETLDLGFDLERFDDILGSDQGGYLVGRYVGFTYFLYVETPGLYYVLLSISPAKKTFCLLVRNTIEEHTLFSWPDMALEQIAYDTVPERVVGSSAPRIIVTGKLYDTPVKLYLTNKHITLRGGEHLELITAGSDPWMSLPLTTKDRKVRR